MHAGKYGHVGQRGAEVLVDVCFQNRVEVLELDVTNKSDDKNLEPKTGVKLKAKMTGSEFHLTSCEFNKHRRAHQCVEHQRVVRVLLRCLHHDVEQSIQSILQKLDSNANVT